MALGLEVRHVKRLITVLGMVVAIALALGSSALATGQPGAPNVTCGTGNATSQPPGFLKSGFLNTADAHYAGNGAPSLNANSGNARLHSTTWPACSSHSTKRPTDFTSAQSGNLRPRFPLSPCPGRRTAQQRRPRRSCLVVRSAARDVGSSPTIPTRTRLTTSLPRASAVNPLPWRSPRRRR